MGNNSNSFGKLTVHEWTPVGAAYCGWWLFLEELANWNLCRRKSGKMFEEMLQRVAFKNAVKRFNGLLLMLAHHVPQQRRKVHKSLFRDCNQCCTTLSYSRAGKHSFSRFTTNDEHETRDWVMWYTLIYMSVNNSHVKFPMKTTKDKRQKTQHRQTNTFKRQHNLIRAQCFSASWFKNVLLK